MRRRALLRGKDGAKDEDTVLLIMGEGPATSTAAEEK
jgi:hypothetical protein